MKINTMREMAQVIALSENSENENTEGSEKMEKQHISIDGYRKIHRAKNVSFNMRLLIISQDADAVPLLLIPDIFSYIADDISDIKEELKAQGLLDHWLQQEKEQPAE